jgi:hypothetical protein
VLAGFNETQMAFFGNGWYGVLPLAAFHQVVTSFDVVRVVNGLYWMLLPLLSLVNGVLVVRALASARFDASAHVLPLVAAFYALVSLYLEGPLYLYYSVGLSLVAVVWLIGPRCRQRPAPIVTLLLLVAGIALVFHAAQPRQRTPVQILRGERTAEWDSVRPALERTSLRLSAEDRRSYGLIVAAIERESRSHESILVLPNDAELYFLARRRNPVRFYNSALGIQREEDFADVMALLERSPPRLVIFRPNDKYNTAFSLRVMAAVRARYTSRGHIEGLDMYVLEDAQARQRDE